MLYAGEDITVVWRPAFCEHSERCFRQLPQVFDPRERTWITPDGTSAERVAAQVARCPSGALDVRWPEGAPSPGPRD
ncbi:(4Fe-4S)-binding protein [Nocardioides rotundus]|nr:(4Fe-4S)-binding protein [Nocardioides rotundus]